MEPVLLVENFNGDNYGQVVLVPKEEEYTYLSFGDRKLEEYKKRSFIFCNFTEENKETLKTIKEKNKNGMNYEEIMNLPKIKKTYGEILMKCRHCDCLSVPDIYASGRERHRVFKSAVCPECEQESSAGESFIIETGRDAEMTTCNVMPVDISVYNDDHKIALSILFYKVSCYNNKIQMTRGTAKLLTNIKTGQSYITTPKGRTPFWQNKSGICNITNCLNEQKPHHFVYKFLNMIGLFGKEKSTKSICEYKRLLREKLKDFHSYPILEPKKEINDIYVNPEIKEIMNLISWARHPYLDLELLKSLHSNFSGEKKTIGVDGKTSKGKVQRILSSIKNTDSDSLKVLMSKLCIDTKKERKLFLKQPSYAVFKRSLKKHIKNTDNMTYLFEQIIENKIKESSIARFKPIAVLENSPLTIASEIAGIKRLAAIMIDKCEERIFIDKVVAQLKKDIRVIRDTAHIYNYIVQHKEIPETDFTGSLSEIHDVLSAQQNRIKHKPVPIDYSEEETLLEDSISDIVFELPEDTGVLRAIGDEMKICVGSYSERALQKTITIVRMAEGKESVGCIEILDGVIVQAKAKRNMLLKGKHLEAILEWARTKELEIDTYDLRERTDNECQNALIAI